MTDILEDPSGHEDAGDFRLSMPGFTVLLCKGAQRCGKGDTGHTFYRALSRHELTAASDGSYAVGDISGIAAELLEFSDQGLVARASDFSTRAVIEVDQLSWRAPVSMAA